LNDAKQLHISFWVSFDKIDTGKDNSNFQGKPTTFLAMGKSFKSKLIQFSLEDIDEDRTPKHRMSVKYM